jgi:hypothetical protein
VKRLSNESSSNASDIIEHYQTGHYFKNGIYYYDEGGENERYLFTLDDNYSNYSLRVYDKIDQVDMNIDQNITGINFLGSIAISMNSDLALVTASLMDSQKDNVIILYSIDKDKHSLCYQRSFDVAMTMCGIAFGEDNQSFLVLQDDIVDVYSLQDGQQMNHYRLESSKLKNARDTVEETAAVQYYKQDNYFDVMNDVILIHKEYLTSSDLEQYCQIYRLSTGEYITDINCGTINAGLCYESEYSVYNYDLGLLVVGYKDLILAQINVP